MSIVYSVSQNTALDGVSQFFEKPPTSKTSLYIVDGYNCLQLHHTTYAIHKHNLVNIFTIHVYYKHTLLHSPLDVLADADQAVGVLEEHLLQRDHHALEVRAALLDVVADLV